jgi:hypothetical protein
MDIKKRLESYARYSAQHRDILLEAKAVIEKLEDENKRLELLTQLTKG